MDTTHLKHLYWRAGFGINPKELDKLSHQNKDEIVADLFTTSKTFTPLVIDVKEFKTLTREDYHKDKKTERDIRKKSRNLIRQYNKEWIQRLVNPQELLREKMTLFWANHFVCSDNFITYVLKYNNTLREHALGHFGDFVKAISRETAMIRYLDLKQNRKQKPNENFARELMELFTLGVGHYTEEDIKESAKAFTGYNHNFKGDFVFKDNQHDEGFKYFLGKAGHYIGDDIVDIILEHKQCARFICKKIYIYFVNDEIDETHINAMVDEFYPHYNIESLMRFVFSSDWFYDTENMGTKIKSPIELLVGMQQVVPVTFIKPNDVFKIQKALGQVLLYPPNVAGWKGGKNWIDTNTILIRLKLPSLLLNNGVISTKEKDDFDDAFKRFYEEQSKNTPLKVKANWEMFNRDYKKLSFNDMRDHLIISPISDGTKAYLSDLNTSSKKDNCIQLMSLPEYQMC